LQDVSEAESEGGEKDAGPSTEFGGTLTRKETGLPLFRKKGGSKLAVQWLRLSS